MRVTINKCETTKYLSNRVVRGDPLLTNSYEPGTLLNLKLRGSLLLE